MTLVLWYWFGCLLLSLHLWISSLVSVCSMDNGQFCVANCRGPLQENHGKIIDLFLISHHHHLFVVSVDLLSMRYVIKVLWYSVIRMYLFLFAGTGRARYAVVIMVE
jgi:hypothetical protein